MMESHSFKPAWWARHAHLQTILPVLMPFTAPNYTRERWDTPEVDNICDFIDLDWVNLESAGNPQQKIFILFHGLEGSSQSSYSKALMRLAQARGWTGVVVHWRSCSGQMNRGRVMYHSGFSSEIDWVVKRIAERFPGSVRHIAGVSLGGNALLKWLGESGTDACGLVASAASICAPHDLKAGAVALESGFNQRVYMRSFLSTLKQKALAKLAQFPDLPITVAQIHSARNFFHVDEYFTAPLHGFKNAEDYWQKSSSKQYMRGIDVPTLILNTANDPIVPKHSLARADQVSPSVQLCYTEDGGHVGFVTARQAGAMGDEMAHFGWMPERVLNFFENR